ncbi:hypothetical protein RSAG8_12015, partial [Rhizoctonia solani AG-8 WAC10335]
MENCIHNWGQPPTVFSSSEIELDLQVPTNKYGGRADVLCGTLKAVHQQVAVKAFRHVERNLNHLIIENEIKIWQLLCNHPHIASFLGILPVNLYDPQYLERGLVSFYCDHGDLKTYLYKADSGATNHQLRFQLLLGVIRGLTYAHAQSIVHGDLKARNVLVDGDGKLARICDFGSSSINCKCYSSPDEQEGTTAWESPELWMSEEAPPHTRQSDIWAFGCVALEVQMGMTPWDPCHEGITLAMQTRQMKAGVGTPANADNLRLEQHPIKQHVWDFMIQCWSADPTQRPTAEGLSSTCETLATNLGVM